MLQKWTQKGPKMSLDSNFNVKKLAQKGQKWKTKSLELQSLPKFYTKNMAEKSH